MTCERCGGALGDDALGLNRKYNPGRGWLCKGCLAKKLGVTEQRLDEKIEEFRRAGCMLFSAPARRA